jgi:imidazole glycerol-phosphate synthase subunit HisH
VIAVLDYGIGNLGSAFRALRAIGRDAWIVRHRDEAVDASGVVLPGVGNFGACADALRRSGLDDVVRSAVEDQRPLLGICVGLQLLYEDSEESPRAAGLGILQGSVRRLPGSLRLPQMQWNTVQRVANRSSVLLAQDDDEPSWFYFVHAYAPVPDPDAASTVVGTCDYGGDVVAVVESGTCFGTQFHPEKSAQAGLALLSRFADRCGEQVTS